MEFFKRLLVFAALSTASSLVIGCGGQTENGGGSVTDDPAPVASSLRSSGRHRPTVVQPGGTGGAPATAPADTPPATDVTAAIAAAQTSDGQAIPQGAGPGGACPQVLVMLGFWSCPTLGQTCSYAASGVAHSCACDRTDGEGQTPSWVCDQ